MENPYQSPEPTFGQPPGPPPMAPYRRPGFVRHVRVLAIMMIVQGALELLAGLGLIALAAFMPWLMSQEMQNAPGPPEGPPPQSFFWIILLIYGGMGVAALIAAGLHIAAGLRNYQFRSRTLGIVAVTAGMLTMFTCYCLPTAVGIAVYGLIVFLNEEVSEAFRMGEAGYPASDILAHFG